MGEPADDEKKKNPQEPGKGSPGAPDRKPGGGPQQTPRTDKPKEREKSLLDEALGLAREIAVEGLVSRGLEFANKKLLTRGRRGTFDADIRSFYLDPSIAVGRDQLPRLLDGAWTYLGETAEMVGLDPVSLERALIDHVGGLLVTGQEHDRRYSRTIAASCVAVAAEAA